MVGGRAHPGMTSHGKYLTHLIICTAPETNSSEFTMRHFGGGVTEKERESSAQGLEMCVFEQLQVLQVLRNLQGLVFICLIPYI